MKCPQCSETTLVSTTRQGEEGTTVRRRHCLFCGFRFWTYEMGETMWQELTQWRKTRLNSRLKAKKDTADRDAAIVRRVTEGEKRHLLAEEFGISPSYVSRLCIKAGLKANVRFRRVK